MGIGLTIDSIEYNKKPGKPTVIKVVKDQSVQRDDLYKSGTIHTGQGEPPNSRSRPTPRPKQIAGKPITHGKLLRPGGPGGGPSKLASRPPASRPVPQPIPRSTPHSIPPPNPQLISHTIPHAIPQASTQPSSLPTPQLVFPQQSMASRGRPIPQSANAHAIPVRLPVPTENGIGHGQTDTSSSTNRAPPPPPPPPSHAAAPKKDTYKAMYDFVGQTEGEQSIMKNEVIEVLQKAGNGNLPPFPASSQINLLKSHIRLVAYEKTGWFFSRVEPVRLPRRRYPQAHPTSRPSRRRTFRTSSTRPD